VQTIQEATTVGELARSTPKISATLENRQEDHQTSMVEIEGMIHNQPVIVLIDPGASLSYISPRVVEICKLHKEKFEKSWLVQLATGTKRRITDVVKNCELGMNELRTQIDLNILPLGSYDVLIGMDWLEKFKVVLDCYNKSFTCVDERGNIINIKGVSRPVSIREITTLQVKICIRKGCKILVVHINYNEKEESNNEIDNFPVLQEFQDVFQDIPRLPPKREIDFSIDLIPGAVPASKSPYRMNILELNELKSQLQELIDKEYI
jgi:hypothetical protein